LILGNENNVKNFMDNIFIIEKYQRIDTDELIKLLPDISEMEKDEVTVLRDELKKRGKIDESSIVNDYLNVIINQDNDIDLSDIHTYIENRLCNGEPVESLKIDLLERGIDINKIFLEDIKKEDKIYAYMTVLKKDGLNDSEISQKLNKEKGIDSENTQSLLEGLRKRGKLNVKIGIIIIILAISFAIFDLTTRNWISIRCFTIGASGIILIAFGIKQQKKN
jgi:hypothetical protein